MSRRRARELVFHMIFENECSDSKAEDILKRRLDEDYFGSLEKECSVYSKKPEENQLDYIKTAVRGAIEKKEELNGYIGKYSVGWNVSRISKVSRSLIKLCMYEIMYMGIPVGASVNEALELVRKYDNEEAVPFVNGVLAGFIKNEIKND